MWTPTGPELRGSIVSFWTWNQTADGGMLSHWLPLQIQNLKFLWSLKEFCTVRHRPTSEIYYSPMSLVGPGRRVYWWVSDLGLKLKETMLLRSRLQNVGSPSNLMRTHRYFGDIPVMWAQYHENAKRECLQIWCKYLLWLNDEAIRIWWPKVRAQGHCDFWHNSKIWHHSSRTAT